MQSKKDNPLGVSMVMSFGLNIKEEEGQEEKWGE